MEYKVESSLRDFKAWSGGYDTLATLVERDLVDDTEAFLEMCFEETPTETDINDVLWFEKDMIAEYHGYQDWETLLKETEK